jgi:alpha-D-ribose 1-methylphosphonate 5-triphosphate diphosphatase PhnM
MLNCPEQATVEINANQLARITELLDILDGFLRHSNTVADHLADYLRATGRDHPQLPHGTSYDANLLIDLVSFTAHAPRAHRQESIE